VYLNGTWECHSDVLSGEWTNVYGEVPGETGHMDDQPLPDKAFLSLGLPRLGEVLERMDVGDIGKLFLQRSSFAMIFAK